MNTRTTVGLLAAIVILVIAFFAFHKPATAPVALPTATTTPAGGTATTSDTHAPKIETTSIVPVPAKTPSTPAKPAGHVAFDQTSLVSSSMHPIIMGTASNVSALAIVIDNPQGVGIVGSGDITVTSGHWSYTPALGLTPGVYTVHVLGNGAAIDGKLTITQ